MEQKNQPAQVPTIQNVQPSTPPPKTNIWMIISIILITLILAGAGVFLWSAKTNVGPSITLPTQTQLPTTKPTQQLTKAVEQPTQTSLQKSELVSLGANWNKFTNHVLGFSLKVPKLMTEPYGQCVFSTANGDNSYRPKEAAVPVKIFEDKDTTYIAAEYVYVLGGETKNANNQSLFSKCDKTVNTVANLADTKNYHSPQWQIIVKTINNEAELNQFIKTRYGEGCSIMSQDPAAQSGVFKITVQGDGLDWSVSKCIINYMSEIRYYPAKNKVASWHIGQACNFAYPTFETCLDQEMTDSFKFE